jgi:hypothetical protein
LKGKAGVDDSENEINGGAIYISVSNIVNIKNNTFKNISSINYGGGLLINSSTKVNIDECIFENISVKRGGGINN